MISVPLSIIFPDVEKLKKKLGIKLPLIREEKRIEQALMELTLNCDPRFWFKKLDFKEVSVKAIFGSSKDLTKVMDGFSEGFAVICTIGLVGDVNSSNAKSDMAFSMYFDRAGSELCENLAEQSAKILLERFYTGSNYELSKRYSPGYGDFKLEMQKALFALFSDEKLGVKLSKSFYMEPEKSVSYIVGVRKVSGGRK